MCSRSPPHCLLFPDQSLCVNSWPLQKLAIRRLRSQYLHRISFGQSHSCRAVSAPHNFYPTIYQFLSVRFVIPLSRLTNDSVKIVNFSVFPWRARFLVGRRGSRLAAGPPRPLDAPVPVVTVAGSPRIGGPARPRGGYIGNGAVVRVQC